MKELLEKINKEKALLITKIVVVCIFLGVYSLLFIQGLYKGKHGVCWDRIVIPTLVVIASSVLLFVKVNFTPKQNIFVSILFSVVALFENFIVLQLSQSYESIGLNWKYFVLNMIILTTIFVVLYAIFNSFKGAIIGSQIISVIFGVANYYLIQFRGTGFLAVDILNIETAANVAGGYDYSLNYGAYILIISCIAMCMVATKLGKNNFLQKKWRFLPIAGAIIIAVGCYGIFFGSSRYDKFLKVKYFKPQVTFDEKGMYTTFVESIKNLIVNEPEGYSIEAVKKLSGQNEETRANESQKKPNIIMIMDEAFTDFSSFTDLKLNKDCMPYFHSLKKNAIKGQMFVSIFGGGTAATEFEALTSNSMAFVPNGITAYSTYINDPMASLATVLRSQNYGGMLAMHPYKGSGYKRDKVYPLLGFDRFITMDDFDEDTDRVGRHISDVADVERIISEYEDYRKENENPFFMFNVTMQNHSPFNSKNVSKDIKLEYKLTNVKQAKQYMNLMQHTDEGLKTLVEYFKKVDEPTMIVFFGDHQPKLENNFYRRVSKGFNLKSVYRNLEKHNTQFVIWANYDIEKNDQEYISANYMSSLILDTAGLAKNKYQSFVSKVKEEVPILTKYGYIGKNGKFYQCGDKNSPYYDILHKYDILQYNNIFDVKNRVNELFELKEK